MILKSIPKSEWPQMRLKVLTADALKGKRPLWGYSRKWEGNYLANVSFRHQLETRHTHIHFYIMDLVPMMYLD